MFRILIVGSMILTAGCSAYDVTRLSADAAASVVAAMIDEAISLEDKVVPIGPDEPDDPDFVHVFWDEDVSRCIPVEKRERELDRLFDAVEDGRDYVILPNGEQYPVNLVVYPSDDELTVTQECIERH